MTTLSASNASTPRNRGWVRAAAWTVGAVGGFFVLHRFDLTLMTLRYRWLEHEPRLLFDHLIEAFRQFGQVVSVVVVLVLVLTYAQRWKRIVCALLIAELLAAAVYYPGKLLVARYRPEAAVQQWADGDHEKAEEALQRHRPADTWIGIQPGNWDRDLQSFPSGHAAGAFVLAGVLVRFYPELAVLLWTLAGGCAASRALDAVHWPSDCWAGAIVGFLAARIALALCARPRVPISPDTFA